MANNEHFEILNGGVDAWNQWRIEHTEIEIDLVQPDLQGADLRGLDLRWANFRGTNLMGADLSGTDLQYANLRRAKLAAANLTDANLRDADLCGADLWAGRLARANLRRANLGAVDLSETLGLTQGQIDKAQGDEYTQLPQHHRMRRPSAWPNSVEKRPPTLSRAMSFIVSLFKTHSDRCRLRGWVQRAARTSSDEESPEEKPVAYQRVTRHQAEDAALGGAKQKQLRR